MNEALFFDDNSAVDSPLFGTLTIPDDHQPDGIGVLFCHAFSEERQRSYRSTFLFAQDLAKAGIPSFRFDYKGTGDSTGQLVDTTFDSMVEDTLNAYTYACRRLGVSRIILIGIRLGGAVAVRASSRLPDLEDLILWNPVIEGKRYYRDLMRTEAMINLARKSGPDPQSKAKDGFVEVDSELLSPDMVSQLKTIDLANETHRTPNYYISGREDDKLEQRQIAQLVGRLEQESLRVSSWAGESGEFWTARSMYDAFYPTKTFECTLGWLNAIRNG